MTMTTNKEMLYRERKAELDKKIQPKKRNVKIRSYQRQINNIQAKMRKGDVNEHSGVR